MDNILASLKKPKKMSVLDKSAHDWKKMVATEGLADELDRHSKSKDNYLDKQNFLNAVDHNRFEQERLTREQNRKK